MEPRGLAVLSIDHILVTAGDKLVMIARRPSTGGVHSCSVTHSAALPVLPKDASDELVRMSKTNFCGVAVNNDASAVRLTSDRGVHGVWELLLPAKFKKNSASSHETQVAAAADTQEPPAVWACTLIAGGNREFDAGIKSIEGTALKARLWRPTFCCYILKSFVFSHSGSGTIMMVTDLYPYATQMLPIMRKMAEAAGLSDGDNATSLYGESPQSDL